MLLQRRYNTGYHDGQYGLCAGHVEEKETFTETIIREAKEEIGLYIAENNLQLRYIAHLKDAIGQRMCFFHDVWKWDGELENIEPEKVDEIGWFEDDNLPLMKLITRKCLDAISELSGGRPGYGEYGWD